MKRLVQTLCFIMLTYIAFAKDSMTIIYDSEIEDALRAVANPILTASGINPEDVALYTVQNDEANAFVSGGQQIFITTGMLKFSQDPEVLAGVLAHEVGHIVGGHLVQHTQKIANLKKQLLISTLIGGAAAAATGSAEPIAAGILGGQLSGMHQFFAFSRIQESAADATSARVLHKLGVPTNGLVKFLKNIATYERGYSDAPLYYRTHPLSKTRIDYLESHNVASKRPNYLSQDVRKRFAMMHAKIIGFTDSKEDIELNSKTFSPQMYLYANAIYNFRISKFDIALSQIQELLQIEPDNPYFLEVKGDILLASNKASLGIKEYKKAYDLNKFNIFTTLQYANALIYGKQDLNKAESLLKIVINKDRSMPYPWKLLTDLYRNWGNMNSMHTAAAYYAYLTGDTTTMHKHINSVNQGSITQHDVALLEDLKKISALEAQQNRDHYPNH